MSNIKVALVGNPNTGKTSVFNALTGLNQKVGNFPGITVDKKTGTCKISQQQSAEIIDLPGTYSLYAKSNDEQIVIEILADTQSKNYPDVLIVVVDATNLKRNLLLYSQVADLNIPVILALNMTDLAEKNGLIIDVNQLAEVLGIQVVPIAARINKGIDDLKKAIGFASKISTQSTFIEDFSQTRAAIDEVKTNLNINNDYLALHLLHQGQGLHFLSSSQKADLQQLKRKYGINSQLLQAEETQERFRKITKSLIPVIDDSAQAENYRFSDKIDRILTHKIWGFALFIFILLFIFNAIFAWSVYPMDWIEQAFIWIQNEGHQSLPSGVLTDLFLDGIVAGLSGIVIFVPQIAILFCFISILEDTGYMARVTFMMDKIMRKVGLSGKSVVPMIGGLACAVPSIMSTRTIENWKDRIITIMVTPLVSCSARLPVYTLLISLVVPSKSLFGVINMQGLVLTALYLIGLFSAVVVAAVMKFIIKTKEKNYFIMELPIYRMPRWKNVFFTIYEKSKTFIFEAGKVIIAISIVLWVLATYGPSKDFEKIDLKYENIIKTNPNAPQQDLEREKASEKLEASYAGILGHVIEPVIRPMGFDWKIGIALITSFAAREAFVGTMATIYSVDGDSELALKDKMRLVKHADGTPVYTFASGLALMLFYAFAMQCMSTVAIVKRETKSWKWPIIQIVYMTTMAYLAAVLAFQVFK